MAVADADRKPAAVKTSGQVQYPEHLHAIGRDCVLLVHDSDLAEAEGSTSASTMVWWAMGRWVAVASGVGTCANSARPILVFAEINVAVSTWIAPFASVDLDCALASAAQSYCAEMLTSRLD